MGFPLLQGESPQIHGRGCAQGQRRDEYAQSVSGPLARLGVLLLVLSGTSVGAAGREVPLIEAVKKGDAIAVRALMRTADVNASEADGTTALHWAVHRDDLTMTELLIGAGAKVTATNRYAVAPLALACENGNAAIVERLLTAGADVNQALPGGETPLHTAARTGIIKRHFVSDGIFKPAQGTVFCQFRHFRF